MLLFCCAQYGTLIAFVLSAFLYIVYGLRLFCRIRGSLSSTQLRKDGAMVSQCPCKGGWIMITMEYNASAGERVQSPSVPLIFRLSSYSHSSLRLQTLTVTVVCCLCFLLRAVFFAYRPATGSRLPDEVFVVFCYCVPECVPCAVMLLLLRGTRRHSKPARKLYRSAALFRGGGGRGGGRARDVVLTKMS